MVDQPARPQLLGEYEHAIDDKNRLTLPAKFRDTFSDGVFITRGMDRCLAAYTRADWQGLIDSLATLDPLSRETRTVRRFFFAGASEAELDRQGRIVVPASLARHAGLAREVIVAGVYDHLEIWDRAAWYAQLQEVEGSAEHVAERLAAKRD